MVIYYIALGNYICISQGSAREAEAVGCGLCNWGGWPSKPEIHRLGRQEANGMDPLSDICTENVFFTLWLVFSPPDEINSSFCSLWLVLSVSYLCFLCIVQCSEDSHPCFLQKMLLFHLSHFDIYFIWSLSFYMLGGSVNIHCFPNVYSTYDTIKNIF